MNRRGHFIERDCQFMGFIKRGPLKGMLLLLCATLLLVPCYVLAEEGTVENPLIIYYSRTGKTKLVCDILEEHLNAHLLEIEDPVDRSGHLGYMKSAYDAFTHRRTPIEPEQPDLSPYPYIIIASPIWSWNLCTPIHTLFEKNSFEGKKIILITTANIHIMKYEKYADDAPFIKRFLRDYLRGKRETAVNEVSSSGGEFIGHYHFATKDKTDEEIKDESLKCVEYIEKIISNME